MKAKLPAQYSARERKQAAAEQKVRDEAIAYTSTLVMAVVANVLIERHGWGSRAGATRLPALLADVEREINEAGERYGCDCILAAQLRRLREHGVDLQLR